MRTLIWNPRLILLQAWRTTGLWLCGVGLLSLLVGGCAAGSIAIRGYYNEPGEEASDEAKSSGAYVASSRVPWCVNLHHPSLTLEEVTAFRKAFYEAYGKSAERGERKHADVRPNPPSCWSLVQQVSSTFGAEEHNHDIIALALPGGGSRSTVFAATVMFELQLQQILKQVDLISSVSGGSIAAALYARSCDDHLECRALYGEAESVIWRRKDEEHIFDMLGTNFQGHGIARLFLPWNAVLYRTTRYDRTDTLAGVFGSYLLDADSDGAPYGITFGKLNPRRPNWLINAVNTTGGRLGPGPKGQQFLFALETFEQELHSDLHNYPVAFGITGSTAFPGALHPLTVAAFPGPGDNHGDRHEPVGFRHIVDGGLYDRLGGEAIRLVLEDVVLREKPCVPVVAPPRDTDHRDCLDRAVIVVLDSGLPIEGEDASDPDLRVPFLDLLLNRNVRKAPYALLEIQAELRLDVLKTFVKEQNHIFLERYGRKDEVFKLTEIRLRDVEGCVANPVLCAEIEGLTDLSEGDLKEIYRDLWEKVLQVPLSLHISAEDAAVMRRAARILVRRRIFESCERGSPFVDCTIYAKLKTLPFTEMYTGSPPPEQ